MVRCSRMSCLLSLVVFWSVLTLIHYSSTDVGAFTQFLLHPNSQPLELTDSPLPLNPNPNASPTPLLRSLESFKVAPAVAAAPPTPVPRCNFTADTPESLYTFNTVVRQSELQGRGFTITISLTCSIPIEVEDIPRSYFRIHTTGDTMTAIHPTTIMEPERRTVVAFLPTPDAGEQQLHVKLMIYNSSKEANHITFPPLYKFTPEEVTSRWVDRPIKGSPFNFTILPHTNRTLPAMQTYTQLPDLKTYINSRLPICAGHRWRQGLLMGRWLMGPSHPHITRQWWSDSVFDDYKPRWAPYDCRLDYTASLLYALRRIKWLNIVGGQQHEGPVWADL